MKINLFIASFVLTCYGYAQGYTGDTWATAQRTKKANIVLVNVAVANFAEMENGVPSGICFDIMDDFVAYVKSNYGVTLTVDYQPVSDPENFGLYMNTIKKSANGVFGLGHTTITKKRKTEYEFSPPFFSNISILLTSKSSPDLSSIDNIGVDFKGMTAVIQKGSSHHERVKKLQGNTKAFNIEFVTNYRENLEKVASSPKYFTFIDFPIYLVAIKEGMNLKRHAAGDALGEKFGIVMPKGSDWAPVMEAFFQANGGYTSSAAYRKILEENMGTKILRLIDAMAK